MTGASVRVEYRRQRRKLAWYTVRKSLIKLFVRAAPSGDYEDDKQRLRRLSNHWLSCGVCINEGNAPPSPSSALFFIVLCCVLDATDIQNDICTTHWQTSVMRLTFACLKSFYACLNPALGNITDTTTDAVRAIEAHEYEYQGELDSMPVNNICGWSGATLFASFFEHRNTEECFHRANERVQGHIMDRLRDEEERIREEEEMTSESDSDTD